jgi:predicted enzyme related to lactoylglutathione lyase
MGNALMIGGVFLLARDPGALAAWYREHLGWQFQVMQEDETRYVELYYRDIGRPDTPQHLVYAIMPGEPGEPGRGHIINYRVDDIEAIARSLHRSGVDTTPITTGPDADGTGKFLRLQDPEGHRLELWQHLEAS